MSGACTGTTGLEIMATIQAAAQMRTAFNANATPYGFSGDASSTINGKYFGQLVWSAF
jgi:hypothetical protein